MGAPHEVLLGYVVLIYSNIYKSRRGGRFPLARGGSVTDPQAPEFRVLHFPVVIRGIRRIPFWEPTTFPNGREWIRPWATTLSHRLLSVSRTRVRGFGYVIRNIFQCLFPDTIFWRFCQLLFCPLMMQRASLYWRVDLCSNLWKTRHGGTPKSTGGQSGLRGLAKKIP